MCNVKDGRIAADTTIHPTAWQVNTSHQLNGQPTPPFKVL